MMKASSVSKAQDMGLLLASYQNHILYCAAYVAVCSYLWQKLVLEDGELDPLSKGLHCAGLVLAAFALKVELTYMINRARLPPGDSGWPVTGHMVALVKDSKAHFVKQFQKYGPMVTLSCFMYPVVLVTNDDDVQWAMTLERKGKTKAFALPHLRKLLGEEAVFLQSGDGHKRLRKIFEPAFTPKAVRDYTSAIDTITQEQLAKWCASGTWQTPTEWALLAMRIFFVCAFGEANEARMVKLAFLFENWTAGFNCIIPISLPGTALGKAHYYKRELDKELVKMIEEFKTKNPPSSEAGQKSVMGRLCYGVDEEGNAPSEKQLLDNLRFFLVAGFDTTKASFSAIAHFVKDNPHLESALVEEVRGLKDPLDTDQIKTEAPILNGLLAETWRLAPPLSSHAGRTTEEVHYKGYTIPKGTIIAADIQAHNVMNEGLYVDPSKFHFERWLESDHPLYKPQLANTEKIDYNVMNSKYRAFNMGTHMCLGGHFAKLEVRIVVARLFQKYRVETTNTRVKTFPLLEKLSDFRLSEREE